MNFGAVESVSISGGQTLTDDGTVSFAAGDTVSMNTCCSQEIAVVGTLTANDTTFTGNDGNITVNPGGVFTPTGSTFNVPLFVQYNDVAVPGGRQQCELRPDRAQLRHPPQW